MSLELLLIGNQMDGNLTELQTRNEKEMEPSTNASRADLTCFRSPAIRNIPTVFMPASSTNKRASKRNLGTKRGGSIELTSDRPNKLGGFSKDRLLVK